MSLWAVAVGTCEGSHPNIMLMLAVDIATQVFPDISDPQEVVDELLFTVGKTIKYNPRNNLIVTIS